VTVGAYKYSMICPKFKQNIIQNQCPEFLVHFQKQWGNSVMSKLIRKSYLHPGCNKIVSTSFISF
jgi:hypothetical protein